VSQPIDQLTAVKNLTAQMSAGNEHAVEIFYRKYFNWLYAQARRATRRDEAFCMDVVQETVLRIIRTIRPVESENQLLAWLRLVVHTTAWDLLRSERRRQTRETVVVAMHAGSRQRDDPPDEMQQDWLKQKIAQFDPQLARIIELRYSQQWTLTRIAGLMGLSLGTVDGRIRRALKHLRDLAAEELD
jgi:RNA polymerase sigma-70 factor (ECF subfamily)